MRAALDSNILLYGFLEPQSDRGQLANDLIARAAGNGVVAVQAIGEFLRVVRRRRPEWLERAVRRSKLLPRVFGVIGTDQELLVAASSLVVRHRLQFWDAVILKASARGGADLLLSEDMQDGALLDGVQIVNPLAMANRATLDRLLPR